MSHLCQVLFRPKDQQLTIRCVICGEVLVDNAFSGAFELAGDCRSQAETAGVVVDSLPPNTLGIHVSENVGVRDIYGGSNG